jgi:tRNA-splicing ligase RtcB
MSYYMDLIYSNLSFGVGRVNDRAPEHSLFDDPAWKIVPQYKEMARQQLGTIGSGNHYVDLFRDEDEHVWVGVHFGSRGLGHKTATQFLKAGGAKESDEIPLVLKLGTPLGDDYMEAMRLAGAYAYAGRDWVCEEVARLLGANIVEEVHNHHNYAWRETHGGTDYIVVRKGATPAFPGQKGFIGGSMGEAAVIVEGVEHPDHALDLYSTVHGAGRVMSRTAAKGKKARPPLVMTLPGGLTITTERPAVPGRIARDDMDGWLKKSGVELRGADVDEAPQAYKRLPEVLAHHANGIRILHTLTPIGVAMAGPREHDPFKD